MPLSRRLDYFTAAAGGVSSIVLYDVVVIHDSTDDRTGERWTVWYSDIARCVCPVPSLRSFFSQYPRVQQSYISQLRSLWGITATKMNRTVVFAPRFRIDAKRACLART